MPPMLSDDESMSDGVDDPETVPAKSTKGKGKGKAPPKPESEDEQEDGSDEEAEDEYSVDKILEHRFERGGVVKYKVKWLGYEDEADMTWEPAANLETAPEKLKEYHNDIGGTPQPKGKKKGAQKRTASEALDSPAPSASKRCGGRKSQVTNGAEDGEQAAFTLPKGSWESEVSHVMSIVEEDEPDEKKPGKTNKCLMGFLQWNDERKSKHPMKTLRTKCPQALLTYYENHLLFAEGDRDAPHISDTSNVKD